MAQLTRRETDLLALRQLRKELQELEKTDNQLKTIEIDIDKIEERYSDTEIKNPYDDTKATQQMRHYDGAFESKKTVWKWIVLIIFSIMIIGVFVVSCVYYHTNFDEVVRVSDEGEYVFMLAHYIIGIALSAIAISVIRKVGDFD